MRAEGDEASSGSRGASTGSTAKRSKRGPGEAFHEDGSSWAPESELDVSQPKPAPRKDTVLPLNKLVRTLSLEVPDKPAAPAIAPPASVEPSTSLNTHAARPGEEEGTSADGTAASSEVLEACEVVPPAPADRAQTPPLPNAPAPVELSALPPPAVKKSGSDQLGSRRS